MVSPESYSCSMFHCRDVKEIKEPLVFLVMMVTQVSGVLKVRRAH